MKKTLFYMVKISLLISTSTGEAHTCQDVFKELFESESSQEKLSQLQENSLTPLEMALAKSRRLQNSGQVKASEPKTEAIPILTDRVASEMQVLNKEPMLKDEYLDIPVLTDRVFTETEISGAPRAMQNSDSRLEESFILEPSFLKLRASAVKRDVLPVLSALQEALARESAISALPPKFGFVMELKGYRSGAKVFFARIPRDYEATRAQLVQSLKIEGFFQEVKQRSKEIQTLWMVRIDMDSQAGNLQGERLSPDFGKDMEAKARPNQEDAERHFYFENLLQQFNGTIPKIKGLVVTLAPSANMANERSWQQVDARNEELTSGSNNTRSLTNNEGVNIINEPWFLKDEPWFFEKF